MIGSWTIRLLKRDGSSQEFDPQKLTAAFRRAILASGEAAELPVPPNPARRRRDNRAETSQPRRAGDASGEATTHQTGPVSHCDSPAGADAEGAAHGAAHSAAHSNPHCDAHGAVHGAAHGEQCPGEPPRATPPRANLLRAAHDRAQHLCDAILFYLARGRSSCLSTGALFEMCLTVLHHVGMPRSAQCLGAHRQWRRDRRHALRIRHESGQVTCWEKSWLAEVAVNMWNLSPAAARVLAAQVEAQLLQRVEQFVPDSGMPGSQTPGLRTPDARTPDRTRDPRTPAGGRDGWPATLELPRHAVLDLLNETVAAYGLADAVPARL